jgi:TatD DNase family protein
VKALEIAVEHPQVFVALGNHPNDARSWEKSTTIRLKKLSTHTKVRAIGEIGLDYYRDRTPREKQRQILLSQLSLAQELNLPVVLHMREAGDAHDEGECTYDLLSILNDWVNGLSQENHPLTANPGVLHSYSGSLRTASEVTNLNFYIGVSGPVTFRNAKKQQSLIANLPLQSMLVETDAPFLTPHPYRGKRNEPANIGLVADKIAELHRTDMKRVAAITSANAAKLFKW